MTTEPSQPEPKTPAKTSRHLLDKKQWIIVIAMGITLVGLLVAIVLVLWFSGQSPAVMAGDPQAMTGIPATLVVTQVVTPTNTPTATPVLPVLVPDAVPTADNLYCLRVKYTIAAC